MAAIIAQMAAANRERKKNLLTKTHVPTNKSNVYLPPFDPVFDPIKHNKFMRKKIERERRQQILEEIKVKSVNQAETYENSAREKIWKHRFEKCLAKVDQNSNETEENQIHSLMIEEIEKDLRVMKITDVFKATMASAFILFFVLLLAFLFFTFQ